MHRKDLERLTFTKLKIGIVCNYADKINMVQKIS